MLCHTKDPSVIEYIESSLGDDVLLYLGCAAELVVFLERNKISYKYVQSYQGLPVLIQVIDAFINCTWMVNTCNKKRKKVSSKIREKEASILNKM
jgi:hypothetical protein